MLERRVSRFSSATITTTLLLTFGAASAWNPTVGKRSELGRSHDARCRSEGCGASGNASECRSIHIDTLVKVLTYPVVAGKMNSGAIKKAIKMGGGKAQLKTVAGGTLTATMSDGKLMLTDEKGGTSTVTLANVMQSNGVIHVVDTLFVD